MSTMTMPRAPMTAAKSVSDPLRMGKPMALLARDGLNWSHPSLAWRVRFHFSEPPSGVIGSGAAPNPFEHLIQQRALIEEVVSPLVHGRHIWTTNSIYLDQFGDVRAIYHGVSPDRIVSIQCYEDYRRLSAYAELLA
jgi:hypothetical protein